ncbi:probable 28S ribosomal protein S26, mitochondrial [Anopheles nili]|uniref:probable 28S ribosomal protein S26, mitochondrial n=1 Tax=Anopheles nili TaxID=185578 RepID=UPI00237BA26A|nr:probable 28S ribosomal protein S26, mitochondrial [Anopheles nili]
MARISAVFSGVFTKPRSLALLQYTTVRFRRKPRWLGTAKSKLFRVPERKKQIEEEIEELKRLHNNYRTQMKAVRKFLRDEVEASKLVSRAGLVLQTPEQEEAEWQEALRRNDEWNRQTAAIREERLSIERAARKEYILERLVLKEQREMDKKDLIESKVRAEKEQSKSFITRENIDKAIELALVQPTSYNFALDREGNVHQAAKSKTTNETSKSN